MRHMVMFHEDEDYAMKIRLRFLQKGILNGERCIYVTPEAPATVEARMNEYGVDVKKSKDRGLLKVIQARDDLARDESVTKRQDLLDEILRERTAQRVAFDEAPSMGEAGIRGVLELERYAHTATTADHNGHPSEGRLLFCSYSVKALKPALHAAWMSDLLKLHDSVVFAPASSEGIGFMMR
ncbi:MAG: MEDS domain-containing protein [Bacteroidetes bacterium]|nr:MEDS domain-containing protein [Bacteroidota bacterium]